MNKMDPLPEQQNTIPPNPKKNLFLGSKALRYILLVLMIGLALLVYYSPRKTEIVTENQNNNFDQKTYTNEEYGFEFKYPSNFVAGKYIPEEQVQSDIGWNKAIVLVEPDLLGVVDKEKIPVGEISTISFKPITTSQDFYRRQFIAKAKADSKFTKYPFEVRQLLGYPGSYGDTMHYYLVYTDNSMVEITAHKNKFSRFIRGDFQMNVPSNYDKVIEEIISTFKFCIDCISDLED